MSIQTETGWTKDVPTTNGWYWLKDDKTGPVLAEALNGCFYIHSSRYLPEPNDEWLGPISPLDLEELIRLREWKESAQSETLEQIANRICRHHLDSERVSVMQFCDIEAAILSALRNERERGAKVADNHEGTHGNMHFGGCGAAIAATIRSQP